MLFKKYVNNKNRKGFVSYMIDTGQVRFQSVMLVILYSPTPFQSSDIFIVSKEVSTEIKVGQKLEFD